MRVRSATWPVASVGSAGLAMTSGILLLLAACGPAQVKPTGPNIVLITVDTLRADALGSYGNSRAHTPTMDSLAVEGVRFERVIAQVPLTVPSHAAILTGTYPMWNRVRDWSDGGLSASVPTLAEIFKRRGYTTAAFVSAFVLDSMWGLDRGFDLYEDDFGSAAYKVIKHHSLERPAEQTVQRTLAWLEGGVREPFFLWLHLYDPHAPYSPPEPFRARFRDHPYDGEIAYTDRQLGRLMDTLKTRGLYDGALILLTSDHGEAFGEHQERQHGFFIYNPTILVPLIAKFPKGFPTPYKTVSPIVNSVDIAPTLVHFAGLPAGDLRSFQGKSLLTLVEKGSESAPRYGYSESLYPRNAFGWHALFGIHTDRFHYILAPKEELYALDQDSGETRNLSQKEAAATAELRLALRDIHSRFSAHTGQAAAEPVGPEVAERLRSLGYVSLAASRRVEADDPTAADPKDQIGTYNQILRAIELSEGGRWAESNAILSALRAKQPQAYLVPFLLGENLKAQGRPREAAKHYRQALELQPTFDQAAIGLAKASHLAEDNAQAENAYLLALEINPRNFLARLALARVYWRLNRHADAERHQLQVLAENPRLGQAHAAHGITLVRMRRFQEGLAALQRGIALGYHDAEVHNFIANAYRADGRTAKAISAYQKSLELDPKYPTAYLNLALTYAELGEPEKARAHYARACQLNPELCRQVSFKPH